MAKSIVIIGAGLGGLAAGVYGQMNGFSTSIYEAHSCPGGQCASWERGGYVFDCCIHHLMGCSSKTKLNRIWAEIGAMPCKMVRTRECVGMASSDGRLFRDYYDTKKLGKELLAISPRDGDAVRKYVKAIDSLAKLDTVGDIFAGRPGGFLKDLPFLLKNWKWFTTNMTGFADWFQDPFLKKALPMAVYSMPEMPLFVHLMRHAYGKSGDIAWPVGGSRTLIAGIERKYKRLGGVPHYGQKVEKILVNDGKATGVRLADGTEIPADYVISNADGRKTLLEMLDGKFMDKRQRGYCAEPDDETNWAVHVFLGVDRDLSKEPSSLVMLLDKPITIAGHILNSLEMQIYGFDRTMAPKGKGVIKAELVSSYSYWKKLAADRTKYEAEKEHVVQQVVAVLEQHFSGITEQVEVTDVPTLLTWERFMGGTHGFCNAPKKRFSLADMFRRNDTVPGLDRFYFAGVWATSMGATFANAQSGKTAVQKICKKEKLKFRVDGD